MELNTCGNCPFMKLYKTHYFTTAYCGKTGDAKNGLIVPHEYDGVAKTITFTRVPMFCENPDATPQPQSAPQKDWVTIKLNKEIRDERV